MKQSRNHHPITDALNNLQEDTVLGCLQEDIIPRSVVSPGHLYRRLAVAAACLTLAAAIGLTALLPLMRPESPAIPGTNHTDTSSEYGEEYPFLSFQMLSYSEGEAEENNGPVTILDSTTLLRTYDLYLQFDCAEGETVTITSHDMGDNDLSEAWESALKRVEELDPDHLHSPTLAYRILYREFRTFLNEKTHTLLKLEDNTYVWCGFSSQASERDYDVVSFLIRNENGEITGAGSVCIGTLSQCYNRQLRYEVLGSTRFDTPLTEEAAKDYLTSLEATAEEAYANMDFSPQTDKEGYAIASAQARSQFANAIGQRLEEYAYGFQFHFLTFTERQDPQVTRRFFLFPDGTYAEVAPEGADAYDAMLAQIHSPNGRWDYTDAAVLLTDGRTITFRSEPLTPTDESMPRTGWIPVFTSPTEETA